MKSNEFPSFPTKATGLGGPHFSKSAIKPPKSVFSQLLCKGAPRLGLMTCNHSEDQGFGADDRKETKIEVRTNTNGPKLEQTRCHFGAKWSTSWRKIVQKWGSPVTDEGQTDLDHPAPRAWSFKARWQTSALAPQLQYCILQGNTVRQQTI